MANRIPAAARFQQQEAKSSQAIPTKLTLNLTAPHVAIFTKKEVDMVIIPGAGGVFGVLPGHVPTISELKPGVLEVTVSPGEVAKYFVSSGFAFAHAVSPLSRRHTFEANELQLENRNAYCWFLYVLRAAGGAESELITDGVDHLFPADASAYNAIHVCTHPKLP